MSSQFLFKPAALSVALCFGTAFAQTAAPEAVPGTAAQKSAAAKESETQRAQTKAVDKTADKKADKLARGDRKFIEDAAEHSMFEVEVGKLAASKASDAQVKSFGEQLAKDHTAAHEGLQQIAGKHQVELPKSLPRAKRSNLADLQKKSGAEFDREFVREVGIEAHEDDVKKFQKASKDVKDPELKAWIDRTLPALEQHLAMARKLPQAGKAGDAARMGAPAANGMQKAPAAPHTSK